jgi:hypothetical protein
MECRTPLFWTPPPPKALPFQGYRNVQNNISNRYANRYQAPAPASPIKPPEPIPLPIPKNVVLLAVMEAAERQAMMAGGSVMDLSAEDYEDEVAQDGDEDAELQRIVAGMESFSGPCGTYAVREEDGLAVLPHDPRRRSHEQLLDPAETRDEREPFTIEKGQTVQIVDVKDGVFKLARDMGFVVASEKQLVKGTFLIERVNDAYNDGELDTNTHDSFCYCISWWPVGRILSIRRHAGNGGASPDRIATSARASRAIVAWSQGRHIKVRGTRPDPPNHYTCARARNSRTVAPSWQLS